MTKLYIFSLALFALTLFSCQNNNNNVPQAPSGPDSSGPYSELDQEIESDLESFDIKGASICIIDSGKVVFNKAYGYRNSIDKTDTATLFQSASISKFVSAIRVLSLVENGEINLDNNINDFLNNWSLDTSLGIPTARLLLTHSAGTNVSSFPGYSLNSRKYSSLEVLNGYGNTPKVEVTHTPDSIWQYSGGGYVVLQKAIEDITNSDFSTDLKENLLEPLGMTNSTFDEPSPDVNVSLGYLGSGSEVIGGGYHYYPEKSAAGLWTNSKELATMCTELIQVLNDNKSDGYLQKNTVLSMLTKHKNDHGLGPFLSGENENLIFFHGGQNYGFSCMMVCKPYSKKGYIIMTNSNDGWPAINLIYDKIKNEINW